MWVDVMKVMYNRGENGTVKKRMNMDLMRHFHNRKMEGTLLFNFLKDFSIQECKLQKEQIGSTAFCTIEHSYDKFQRKKRDGI